MWERTSKSLGEVRLLEYTFVGETELEINARGIFEIQTDNSWMTLLESKEFDSF